MKKNNYRLALFFALSCMFLLSCGQPKSENQSTSDSQSANTDNQTTNGTDQSTTEGSNQQVSYEQISLEEAKKLMESEEGYIILDVRTQGEYAGGHIPGAICVPNEAISDEAPAELSDKDQLILVYCRSGNRSKQASKKLAELGYTNIKEFGGIMDWDGKIEK